MIHQVSMVTGVHRFTCHCLGMSPNASRLEPISLFIYFKSRVREGEKEKSSLCCFTSQMVEMARAEPICNHELPLGSLR